MFLRLCRRSIRPVVSFAKLQLSTAGAEESMSTVFQDLSFPGWISKVSRKVNVEKSIAVKALRYFDEGATVPFVVRYRQQEVGGIESEAAYILHRELDTFTSVIRLRNSRIEKLKSNGKYDDDVMKRFMKCYSMEELDEAYSAYKESTSTKVQKALAIPGLEDIAKKLLEGCISSIQSRDEEFHTALGWLIADRIAHHENMPDIISREGTSRHVVLVSSEKSGTESDKDGKKSAAGGKQSDDKYKYADYFNFTKPLRYISTHQTLAIRRGKETASALRTSLSIPDDQISRLSFSVMKSFGVPHSIAQQHLAGLSSATSSSAKKKKAAPPPPLRRHDIICEATLDAVKRLVVPAVTRAAWRECVQVAEEEAVQVFSSNLKSLLLTPPLRVIRSSSERSSDEQQASDGVICGVDPGLKQGHKVVIMNCGSSRPQVLHRQKIFCTGGEQQIKQAAETLRQLCREYRVGVIAIGNGVGRYDAQKVTDLAIAELPGDVKSALVSEAGASVYSVSPLAQKEYPEEEISFRGAISIALRLVDPLCELVKVPPPSLGIGMYQHDIKEKVLEERLGAVLEEVVSEVGADVNSASEHVLGRASGLKAPQAAAIVKYRDANGPFRCLEDLKTVKGIGAVTFQNAAGFLRVTGSEPLDSTIVHPEQYVICRELLKAITKSSHKLSNSDISSLLFSDQLRRAVLECSWSSIQSEVCGGKEDVETLKTIAKWVSDSTFCSTATSDVRGIRGVAPRLLRKGIPEPADLCAGAVVEGTVRNITSFGVFVDIGAGEDALLHKSQYGPKTASGFVIGERLSEVTIIGVNADRGGKISLTLRKDSKAPSNPSRGGSGVTANASSSTTNSSQQQSGSGDSSSSHKKVRKRQLHTSSSQKEENGRDRQKRHKTDR